MYLNAISVEINRSELSAAQFSRLYKLVKNRQVLELLILAASKRLELFFNITDEVLPVDLLQQYLDEVIGKTNYQIGRVYTHDSAFSHFLNSVTGKNSNFSGDINSLAAIKEDYNRALRMNSIGAVLAKMYHQATAFAYELQQRVEINTNSLNTEEVILDIIKKINEDPGNFEVLILGRNVSELSRLIRVFKTAAGSRINLYCPDYPKTFDLSMEMNCSPMRSPEIPINKDTIVINYSELQPDKYAAMIKQINESKANIIFFNLNENQKNTGFNRKSNLFFYNKKHINDVLNLHKQRRSEYIESISDEYDSQNDIFRSWLYSDKRFEFSGIVSRNRAMQNIFETIRRVSRSDISVIINGKTGTGKELIARAIHENSGRKDKPFVAVNCSAIPETLLEAELFGHEKGAFTNAYQAKKGLVETAGGGTLFLDEIGDIPVTIQAKLLRVLQEQEIMRLGNPKPVKVNIRLIAATNQDLEKMIRQKQFRSDLFYRINSVRINLPVLADRKEDIPLLIRHFIDKYNRRHNKHVFMVSDQVKERLQNYNWPGNVRELENVIERAVAISVGDKITITDLPSHFQEEIPLQPQIEKPSYNLKTIEAQRIRELLEKENMNYNRVAQLLGISRTTLWRKMKEHSISKEKS